MVKILVLLQYYIPGYKAGGPIRTIQNTVRYLHEEMDFWIVTRDRDIGDSSPYNGVNIDEWNQIEGAHVFYSSPRGLSMRALRQLVREVEPDLVYLNSYFAQLTLRYLLLRRLGLLPDVPVLLAPRGELSQGALRLKRCKKKVCMSVTSLFSLYSGVFWQATSPDEAAAIRSFYADAPLCQAPNIPTVWKKKELSCRRVDKEPGKVRFIFLSRISPKKNLLFALEQVERLEGKIILQIAGPEEDRPYWSSCCQLIEAMPSNVQVVYLGSIEHEQVVEALGNADFFLLPTLNENFGHAIFEALSAGLPVIISDQTPWQNLEQRGIGWDLPLNDLERWREVLQRCVDMPAEKYDHMAAEAAHFTGEWLKASGVIKQNKELFIQALNNHQLKLMG